MARRWPAAAFCIGAAVLACDGAAGLAQAPAPPAGGSARSARDLLAEAENNYGGLQGKVDEMRAHALFEEAAATGDPVAAMRLAVHHHLGKAGFPKDRAKAAALARAALPQVESLARDGDTVAEYLVGASLDLGIGRPAEPAAALAWYQKAAAKGHPWALTNLGWMYATGHGVTEDPATAVSFYRRSAAVGNAGAMYNLGLHYLSGEGVEKSGAAALDWIGQAAERRHVPAVGYLGKLLLYGGRGAVKTDHKQAVTWLEIAAEAGNPAARFDLGYAHWIGAGGAKEPSRAAGLWRPLAEGGDAASQVLLGWLVLTGAVPGGGAEGTRWVEQGRARGFDGFRDVLSWQVNDPIAQAAFTEGVRALERGAAQGEPHAQALVAWLYFTGQGVAKNDERAVELAGQAAARGMGGAMRILGQAYSTGGGVAEDDEQAAVWYRRGAEAGNSFCMMFLSQMLMKGSGVAVDREEGLAWLRRAAEAGNYWAIADLGNLYDEGWHGLPTDRAEATRWKRRGAELGDERAKGWLMYHGEE